jgi:Cytochrome bd terminal oxidase subunit I/ABC transporter
VAADVPLWRRIFAIGFAIGVVSGIVLTFEFGLNWGRFAHDVGPIVGVAIFMEVTMAFSWRPASSGCWCTRRGGSATPELSTTHERWPAGPLALEIRLAGRQDEVAARAGDTVPLSGPSGVGKSTLLRAITGERTPGTRVLLAGVPTAAIDPSALTEHITLVAQDAHVFDGTIRQNLQLADGRANEAELRLPWSPTARVAL